MDPVRGNLERRRKLTIGRHQARMARVGTIRILDQVKLYRPNRVVEAEDVRALYGVLSLDQGASKGIVTTTSTFAPGVYPEFERLIPGRISLRDGAALREWLHLFRQGLMPSASK